MNTQMSPTPGNDKIPLRLLVLGTVAFLAGLVAGGLMWLSTPEPGAVFLAGAASFGSTFAWLTKHVA